VHPDNVLKQAERAMQNVEALLQEANAQKDDIAQMIIYLRDVADYSTVDIYYKTNYTEIPKVLVLAPVCRPGWLIEIECIAIVKQELAIFEKF
jgi:enamine deaminase RidA (YjgF/YER057c/UK114 family)